MSDTQDGKKIFDTLLEYPLPVKQGVRDYVFYFVPAADGFGGRAREFFDRFYPKHKKADVASLEALITFLQAEITTQGVQQIREITIVSHGSALGLFLPLLNAIPTDKPSYKHLSPFSLALLQKDMIAGNLANFNNQRKAVIAHLMNDSWVTIRACNFGRNNDGLYAVYAFFGGAANVYAPTFYQLFSDCPIGPGERLATRAQVHQHLVKQRFFPKDIHTPDRQDAVMLSLISAGKSSETLVLATTKINDTSSDTAVQYQALITDLNKRIIGPFLRQQFQTAGFILTNGASAAVLDKNNNWVITDTFTHEAEKYQIAYNIYEGSTTGGDTVNLSADASLVVNNSDTKRQQVMHSTREHFPLQLFISEDENKAFKGWLFDLASFVQADPKSPEQVSYEALVALLNAGKFNDGGTTDIALLFKNASHELGANPSITQGTPNATWTVQDSVNYLIKAETADTENGLAQVLSVYPVLDATAKLNNQYDQIADPAFGINADLPGTELMAWLDQYPLKDLISLITFLRDPYDPANVAYLNHAQEALRRKNGFEAWFATSEDLEDMENNPLVNGARFELSMREREDNRDLFYVFDANAVWKEIKSSSPPAIPVKTDLFMEQPFDFKDLPDVSTLSDPDSPFTSMSDLQGLQKQGKERLFSTDKRVITIPSAPDPDCDKYAAFLAKIKEVNSKDMDVVFEALKEFEVEEELTFADYLTEKGGFNTIKLTWELLENFEVYAGHGAGLLKFLGRVTEGELLGALGFTMAILEPIFLEMEFIETQQKAADSWKLAGTIVAIRQWARALKLLTFTTDFQFGDTIHIDPAMPAAPEPYYIQHFIDEWQESWHRMGTPVVLFTDFLKTGFDEGWKEAEAVGNEVLDKVDVIFNDMLKESGLSPCKIQKLLNSGLIDMHDVTKVIMRFLSNKILDSTPRPYERPPVPKPETPEGATGQKEPITIPEK